MRYNHLKNIYSKKKTKKRRTLETMSFRELEKVLDRVFSEYDRLFFSDDNGYCVCITCGSVHYYKDIDAGHFIPRARIATRYELLNVRPQCKKCNRFRSGEHDVFRYKLIDLHGKDAIEALEEKARLGGSFDSYQLKQMIIEYREKVKILKLEKGL